MLPATQGRPALIGVIHLGALPGAPTAPEPLDVVIRRAHADAYALRMGGADAMIIENLGDAPFAATRVEAVTVAAMTRAALAARDAAPDLPLGINVLRNDAEAALGIAHIVGATFVRVNVWTGVMATDQGLIEGAARSALQLQQRLQSSVRVAADVLVKHAVPVGAPDLADVARDTWYRGAVQALIVTGRGTGRPTSFADLDAVRAAVPDAPLWLGSGLTAQTAPALRGRIDAAIVGTALHQDGDLGAPLDVARVRAMRAAFDGS